MIVQKRGLSKEYRDLNDNMHPNSYEMPDPKPVITFDRNPPANQVEWAYETSFIDKRRQSKKVISK